MAKTFDFTHPLFLEYPVHYQELLKRAYKSGMTCSEFIEERLLHSHHPGRAKVTKKAYALYYRLQEQYDFFSPL